VQTLCLPLAESERSAGRMQMRPRCCTAVLHSRVHAPVSCGRRFSDFRDVAVTKAAAAKKPVHTLPPGPLVLSASPAGAVGKRLHFHQSEKWHLLVLICFSLMSEVKNLFIFT